MISLFLFMGAAYADGNETNDFSSIQTMIDDSNPGDSIYLENVTYSGEGVSINIDKDINIYGSNNTVLDAKFSSSIFF